MNRRTMLRSTMVGVAGVAAFGATGCDKKDVGFYTATFIGAMEELAILVPRIKPFTSKAISIIKTFKDAYDAGKFASAVSALENASTVLTDIISQVGSVSDTVKVALAVGGVALRAIAALLKAQATPEMLATAEALGAKKQLNAVDRLANSAALDAVLAASRP